MKYLRTSALWIPLALLVWIATLQLQSGTVFPERHQIREHQLTQELTQRGEEILMAATGKAATVRVTVRCSSGRRQKTAHLYPSATGPYDYVVASAQSKCESYHRDSAMSGQDDSLARQTQAKGDKSYRNEVHSEKRLHSSTDSAIRESIWIESIGVSAVVQTGDREQLDDLEALLSAALNLSPSRGDSIKIVRAP